MTRYGGLVALPGLETSGGSLALQPAEQFEIADVVGRVRLAGVPFILETPKEGADGKPDPANDIRNLKLLRRHQNR